MPRSRVPLPDDVTRPFEVYLNGVRQARGSDYDERDGALLFDQELVREGKLGPWRWFLGAFGIGTYGRDDQVDVSYTVGGKPVVAHALPVERLEPGQPSRTPAPPAA
jgi:hypothetical protein